MNLRLRFSRADVRPTVVLRMYIYTSNRTSPPSHPIAIHHYLRWPPDSLFRHDHMRAPRVNRRFASARRAYYSSRGPGTMQIVSCLSRSEDAASAKLVYYGATIIAVPVRDLSLPAHAPLYTFLRRTICVTSRESQTKDGCHWVLEVTALNRVTGVHASASAQG